VIFVDAGAFVGRYIENDQCHEAAAAVWDEFEKQATPSVTSSFVVAEALTLIGRRTTHHFAAERARLIYASSALRIIRPTLEDELQAVLLFEKFADKSISFVDCISFEIMKRLGITDVFSFDMHFATAGFTVRP
jgi:uncharacterized protein